MAQSFSSNILSDISTHVCERVLATAMAANLAETHEDRFIIWRNVAASFLILAVAEAAGADSIDEELPKVSQKKMKEVIDLIAAGIGERAFRSFKRAK